MVFGGTLRTISDRQIDPKSSYNTPKVDPKSLPNLLNQQDFKSVGGLQISLTIQKSQYRRFGLIFGYRLEVSGERLKGEKMCF